MKFNKHPEQTLVFADKIESPANIEGTTRARAVRALKSDVNRAFALVVCDPALADRQRKALKPKRSQIADRRIRLWQNYPPHEALGREVSYSYEAQPPISVNFLFHQYPNFKNAHVEVVASRDVVMQVNPRETISATVSHELGHGVKIKLKDERGNIRIRQEKGRLMVYIALDEFDFKPENPSWYRLFALIDMEIPRVRSTGHTEQPYGEQLAKHLLSLMYYGKIPDDPELLDYLVL